MQDFIKARRNKDNFWNLVFWLGMSIGLTIGWFLIVKLSTKLCGTIFWSTTILGLPIILKIANNTRFTKAEGFVNSEGVSLNDRLPSGMFIVCALAGCFITGFLMDNFWHGENTTFGALLFFTGILSGLVMYFILKNCPISILFNLKLWTTPNPEGNSGHYIKRDHSTSSSAYFTDARFSNLPNNVYNRDRFR